MKISFIGAGNMGGAMINAIVSCKAAKPEDMYIYDKDTSKCEAFKKSLGVNVSADGVSAVMSSDVVFIAVKPVIVPIVLKELAEALKGKTVVSIAAGVTVKTFLDIIGEDAKLVRSIPNLPAFVGEGISGLYFYDASKVWCDKCKGEIKALFESFGKVVEVSSEKMIDEMIAVTSSSPAYFCMMIDAMADAGVKAGFTRKDALFMAEQAMLGTAKYLIEKEKHPGVLKDEVCSPAGTTIEAVAALEREGFRRSIMAAMDDCRKKAVKKEGYV